MGLYRREIKNSRWQTHLPEHRGQIVLGGLLSLWASRAQKPGVPHGNLSHDCCRIRVVVRPRDAAVEAKVQNG